MKAVTFLYGLKNKRKFLAICILIFNSTLTRGQAILPPIQPWYGSSENLIVATTNPWITPTEKANFKTTATYDETINWLRKLSDASPLITMTTIGASPEGRPLMMVIASAEKNTSPSALKQSGKPLLLVQAGIHAGEIDGKDAGMMLLRDIAFGHKQYLLDSVNFLFIPILNVDGHERSSPYNRPNQRGPENMGWRTNANNRNLNRDYTKLDTKEIQAVVKVINDYNPLLYMDIHVTDGADYQYDITYSGLPNQGYSKPNSNWLTTTYKKNADEALKANGHIPGQVLFSVNDKDINEGNFLWWGEPRFSDAYGDLRHLASILVENHSLKPFKQRVLGTYILLESTLKTLAVSGQQLRDSTNKAKAQRHASIPLRWKTPGAKPDSSLHLGIEAVIEKSSVTNNEYVRWTGKPIAVNVPHFKNSEPADFVTRPKGYYVPASCTEIIERLKMHGISFVEMITPMKKEVEMYKIQDAKFQNESGKPQLFEGRLLVSSCKPESFKKMQLFPKGSVYVSTDQPLGFLNQIFQRTEYIEAYVMEPLIEKMLDESPALQKEFDEKKLTDTKFAENPNAIYNWFYSKSKYYDERYLVYPIGRQL
jgi:murein tripeptide amidase MpaA